jgi:hypothetical protein
MRSGEAMLKLMRKDLILSRRLLLINVLVFLATLSYFAAASTRTPPRVFAGFASLMMAMLPTALITQEDKFKAMTLGCSLPVARKTIVQARFVLSVVLALGGLLAAFLFAAAVPFSNFTLGEMFSSGPVVTALTGATILLSLVLPFTLRFGLRGLLIVLVGFQVVGAVLFTILIAFRSSLDLRIGEAIGGVLARLQDALGPAGFNLSALATLVALLTVSYLVSVRIFEGREF